MDNTYKNKIIEVFNNKKIRYSVYVMVILWLAVAIQVIMNQVFQSKSNILEAFINTKSQISYIELEMAGFYGDDYMSEGDRKKLIAELAGSIGLQIDSPIVTSMDAQSTETSYSKTGKNAESLIKVFSTNTSDLVGNHYVLVRLKVYSNPDVVMELRSTLEGVFNKLKILDTQTTMEVSSSYIGKLTLEEMNEIADRMIENLDGRIAYDNRKEDLYTIYGYTVLIPEYITALGTKINIHVAISYDETADKTEVLLATPVIRGTY